MPTTPKLFLALSGALALTVPTTATAAILLNEIHLRTPASSDVVANDKNFEFVELRSTTGGVEACTNMWIIIIDNEGGNVGEIKEAWPLRKPDGTWMETGSNGLLLLGDDYTAPGSPWESVKAPQTAVGDPSGMGPDNINDADALSFLLVTGYTEPALLAGFTDVDIDTDNDGTGVPDWLDPSPPAVRYTTPLWSTVVDSVGFNGDTNNGAVIRVAYTGTAASVSRTAAATGAPLVGGTTNFNPHNLSRVAGVNTANARAAWYGGKIAGSSSDTGSVAFDASFFNINATWRGLATPGQPNFSSTPVNPVFRINEINANPPGTPGSSPDSAGVPVANDGNFEYIEIINTVPNQVGGNNFSASLAGYTLLVVDSAGLSKGEVLEAWSLDRLATGSNGLLMLGNDYNAGFSPFASLFEAATQIADPGVPVDAATGRYSSMGAGEIPNEGVTFLLVQNWTGSVGEDLDDDDIGGMDAVLPFTSPALDSICLRKVDTTGALEADSIGYSAALPVIAANGRSYIPDNVSRLPGKTAIANADWSAGSIGSEDAYGLLYRNGINSTGTAPAFRGAASPGRPNYSSTPAAGTFRLNEAHINPPTPTDNTEYIEVISDQPHALMTNLWLIVLDASASGSSGRVRKMIDLRGQGTGANRLAIFADGIEEETSALFKFCAGRTLRDDPLSYNANGSQNGDGAFNFTPDSLPDDGVSILLVSFTPATPTGTPAVPDADLDANNDGVLDSAPVWTLIDGVSTGNGIGGVPVVGTSAALAGNISRRAGNMTANSAAAWIGGELTGGTATSFGYSSNFFGGFKGGATPGRHNATAPLPTTAGLLLNEININPPGGDNEKEFFEMVSTDGSSFSTASYSVLLIDSDGVDTGRVLKVYDLDSASTGTNGLLLAGVGYDTAVPWTGAAAPAAATHLFFPDGMAFDDIGRSTDNGAMCVLLVRNFTGRAGDDLDQGNDADRNAADDHSFNPPLAWDSVADSVGIKAFTVNTTAPLYTLNGFIFPGTADLSQPIPAAPNEANGYTPDTVARFGGIVTANSSAAWYGANISGTQGTSTAYAAAQFFPSTLNGGKVTPGQANVIALTDTSDPDHDGVPHLIEQALGMNDYAADNQKLPQPGYRAISGVYNGRKQPVFTVVRPTGGISGLTYTVEASLDLQDWSFLPASAQEVLPNTPSDGMETRTYYLRSGALSEADSAGRVYFRLKIGHQ